MAEEVLPLKQKILERLTRAEPGNVELASRLALVYDQSGQRKRCRQLLEPLADLTIIIIFVIFILLQKEDLRDRFIMLAGGRDLQRTTLALDDGAEGIRANAVNADRIRSGLLTDAMIADRAKARGLTQTEYMSGNLLRREVMAEDVAQAFLAQALALKTTADVTTVDGGNIAAVLR